MIKKFPQILLQSVQKTFETTDAALRPNDFSGAQSRRHNVLAAAAHLFIVGHPKAVAQLMRPNENGAEINAFGDCTGIPTVAHSAQSCNSTDRSIPITINVVP